MESSADRAGGGGGEKSFQKMCAALKVLKQKFHPNYYLATKLKFKIAMVGQDELQGEDEVKEKLRLCGELQGARALTFYSFVGTW